MSKISIIVPVYNSSKTIERCLNSLVNQTIKDIEIIIVNDGSTDNIETIIKEYEKNYKDIIKYYFKENEGVAKARNFGIEKAKSDYILFVDADDYIDIHLIEYLKPYIDKNIDLIKFKLQRVNDKNEIIEKVDGPVFDIVTGQEAFNKLYCTDVLLDSPCVYLIKREMFIKNNFEFKRTYHEDFGLIPLIIVNSKTFVSTPYYLYSYVQVPNSLMRNNEYYKNIVKIEDILWHYDNAIKKIEEMKLEKITMQNMKIYYTNSVILKLYDLKKQDQETYIKEIKKRKMYKNIEPRNLKQFIKRIILKFNIKLYLKMR